jgi:hypothetical protein
VNWQNLVRRTPLQLVAAGMAIGFLLVQILMPDTGGAFIYFQF